MDLRVRRWTPLLRTERLTQRLANLHVWSILVVLAGSGASVVLAFLANWLIANALTPAQFGLYSLSLALMTVLQEVGGSSLDTAIVRLAAPHVRSGRDDAETYFRSGFHLKLLVSGSLAVVLWLSADVIANQVYHEPDLRIPLSWMAAGLVAANLYTYFLARLQAYERFEAYAFFRVLGHGTRLIMLGLVLYIGFLDVESASAVYFLSFLSSFCVGAVLIGVVRRRSPSSAKEPFDWQPLKTLFGFAKWVTLSGVLFAIHMRSDIILLGDFRSSEEVGYYSVAWNLTFFIDLIAASVIIAYLPKYAKVVEHHEFGRLQKSTFLVCSMIALALSPLFVFADEFILILFPDYLPSVAPFRILFVSSIVTLLVHPLFLVFYARNKPHFLTIHYAFLAAASLALGFLLIPHYGIIGAACAMCISRILGAVIILGMLFVERRNLKRVSNDV